LWVFTRQRGDSVDNLTPAIIFRKQINTQRIFCIFGTMMIVPITNSKTSGKKKEEGQRQMFKYFKSQEIPELNTGESL
jgi:hypothetical protein